MDFYCSAEEEARVTKVVAVYEKKVAKAEDLKDKDEQTAEELKARNAGLDTKLQEAKAERETVAKKLDELIRERDVLNKQTLVAAVSFSTSRSRAAAPSLFVT